VHLAGVPVKGDRKPEGFEDAAAQVGVGGREGFREVGERSRRSIPSALAVTLASDLADERRVLLAEAGDVFRAEDVVLEEAVDQSEEKVLAHVLPLPWPSASAASSP
jgi:hypothetical protein